MPSPPHLLTSYLPALALSFENIKFISKFVDVPLLLRHFQDAFILSLLVCGNKKGKVKVEHIELRVLQPTMSPSKMVLGDILTGKHIILIYS